MKTAASIMCYVLLCFGLQGQSVKDQLSGQWKLTGWYDDVPRDINSDGKSTTDLFSQWQGCKKQSILVLNNDGSGSIIYTGPYDNPKCPSDFQSGSSFNVPPWDVDNRTLIFSGSDHDEIYEIIELTATKLVLKGSGFMTCCDPDISYFTGGYLKFSRE